MKLLVAFGAACLVLVGVVVWLLTGTAMESGSAAVTAMPLASAEVGPRGGAMSRDEAAPVEPVVVESPPPPATVPAPAPQFAPSPLGECEARPVAAGDVRWAESPEQRAARRDLARARETLESDPCHPVALRDELVALVTLRDWNAAANTLGRLMELSPAEVELRFQLATMQVRARRWWDALAELEQVVAAEPEHARAWFDLAAVHERVGHLSEAQAAWDRVIELAPTTEAYAQRGEVLLDLGAWAEAAADFERVLAETPDAAEATLNLALARVKLGRPVAARELMSAFVEQHPRHLPALNRLAELALEECRLAGSRGRCEAAIAWCDRSLAIVAEQPEVVALLQRAEGESSTE